VDIRATTVCTASPDPTHPLQVPQRMSTQTPRRPHIRRQVRGSSILALSRSVTLLVRNATPDRRLCAAVRGWVR